jgi:hypothetical protein
MAVGSLKRSSLTAYAKYDSMLAGNTFTPTSFDYEHLGTVTLSANQASVEFTLNGYANDYKHLQLRTVTRTNRADTDDNLILRFNADSGANYSWHRLGMTTSAGLTSQGGSGFNGFYARTAASTNTANSFGVNIIDILDAFSTTKNKTVRGLDGQTGAYGAVSLGSAAWLSTSALTSLTFFINYGTVFLAGSRFSLYGLKGSNA